MHPCVILRERLGMDKRIAFLINAIIVMLAGFLASMAVDDKAMRHAEEIGAGRGDSVEETRRFCQPDEDFLEDVPSVGLVAGEPDEKAEERGRVVPVKSSQPVLKRHLLRTQARSGIV